MPTADGQDRQVSTEGCRENPELHFIAIVIEATGARIKWLPIPFGIDISSTDEHQAVYRPGEGLDASREPLAARIERGNEDGLSAGRHHQVDIGTGDQSRIALPGPPRGDLAVHGDRKSVV